VPSESPSNQAPNGLQLIGELVDSAAKSRTAAAEQAAQAEPPTRGAVKKQAKEATPDGPGTFYVYTDGRGTQHIVDSAKLVPKKHRKSAKKWMMEGTGPSVRKIKHELSTALSKTAETVGIASPTESEAAESQGFHTPSFLLGAILASALFLASYVLRRNSSPLLKAVILVIVVGIAGGAYFGWVRRQAGIDSSATASPVAVVNDAREAVEKLEGRMQKEQKLLEAIQDE